MPLFFNEATRGFIVHVYAVFCAGILMSCIESAIGLLTKSETFFHAPDFINCVISPTMGEYGHWITTQNVRKKILHALHFKLIISIKYSCVISKTVRREMSIQIVPKNLQSDF